jgi:hypothetical protein
MVSPRGRGGPAASAERFTARWVTYARGMAVSSSTHRIASGRPDDLELADRLWTLDNRRVTYARTPGAPGGGSDLAQSTPRWAASGEELELADRPLTHDNDGAMHTYA